MDKPLNPLPPKRPKMRPYIATRFGPQMNYIDADGKQHAVALSEHDLCHLALSIATALEFIAEERLQETALT